MFEDFRIDIEALRVRHAPDILGVFEPVSCLLFMNVTDAEFDTAFASAGTSEPIIETFAHETCHYFQTFCTGYLYRQYMRIRDIYASELSSRAKIGRVWPDIRRGVSQRLRLASRFWMPPSTRAWFAMMDALGQSLEDLKWFEDRSAEYGELSIAGASMPGLHAAVESARAESQRRGNSGLSAQDVFEGAAFVMGKLTAYGPQAERDFRDQISNPESPYERLMHISQRYAPKRPICSPLLMAAALALRYNQPGEAYLPLLQNLLSSTPDNERAHAKMLARSLPVMPTAGAALGTGREIRRMLGEKGKKPQYYVLPMRKIADGAWPVDELDLLTDPNALDGVPLGGLTFGIVTRDGERSVPGTRGLSIRVLFGSQLLPGGPSVASFRKDFLAKARELQPRIAQGLPPLPPTPGHENEGKPKAM
jgi:hypothetical protein